MSRKRIVLVLMTLPMLGLASAASAQGTPSAQQFQNSWKRTDLCEKQAVQKFPDWDAESLQKRDRHAKRCQQEAKVPGRGGSAASGSAASPTTK